VSVCFEGGGGSIQTGLSVEAYATPYRCAGWFGARLISSVIEFVYEGHDGILHV